MCMAEAYLISSGAELSLGGELIINLIGTTAVVHPVSISGQNGELFRGFFLQARIINTSTPVGVFSDLPALTKIVSCSGTSDDSVTHTSSDDKEALSFVWTAPNRCVGSISFIGDYSGQLIRAGYCLHFDTSDR
ncbi:putative ferric-chelate reductase 1 isoform X2 [Lytechinus variegatus]|uniref:putative ferric-chelate reductase 1 isoform X2 n=1 Tax=Lytechinus variegatus TaxID=7654 RepID=UPI001BB118F3|nr:putative ferric-chelate reductase 1 isoform X2 [Lytechinus variegatus]